ncbi:hypothetical protein [Mucilaginibacter jinjuensis]|uniref:LPXTG-motif cell wall-anchored protein n=1 Tax=Mucilaginibacter jinjuensis TaxID=1176721 RepID=A0ABY7TD44_9SPHI|nr:hypothetical protein [Mucilaginibacter jinjuensis]WCT14079.1 hypothetical protein PQO05_09045 [Mucilaginibacter jinjuensis]
MKKYTLLSLFLSIASSVMAINPPACPSGNCSTPGTALPINSGVVYLLAAGLIVGITAIIKYKKLAKA